MSKVEQEIIEMLDAKISSLEQELRKCREKLVFKEIHERQLQQEKQGLCDENQRLIALAMYSPVSGLYNQNFLKAEIERITAEKMSALERSGELSYSPEFVFVAYFDIDGLKKINDTHSHSIGDAVIKHFAEKLKGLVRKEELLIHPHGDEFYVIFSSRDRHKGKDIVRRISQELKNIHFKIKDDKKNTTAAFIYSATAGYIGRLIRRNFSINTLIHKADLKMLKRKRKE